MQDSGLYHKTFYSRKKSVMYKASVFVIVINFLLDFNKHTSFIQYGTNYSRKKFYDTGSLWSM